MTNTSKVQKIAITAFVAVVMAFLFLNLFTVQAYAAGLLDETTDTAHEFSRYPIDNYQLNFYVDSSWDWLPWNWLDGIGKNGAVRNLPVYELPVDAEFVHFKCRGLPDSAGI